MADDMGYGDLSCYGAERIDTPNTTRLAGEGMLGPETGVRTAEAAG